MARKSAFHRSGSSEKYQVIKSCHLFMMAEKTSQLLDLNF